MRKIKLYKPYLRTSFDFGFMGFHTEVASKSIEMYAYKYIELRWYLFKWNGSFCLYKPGEDYKR